MLMNNLAKRLNAQYLDTTSPYYPFFHKGYLCVDSVESSIESAIFVVIRNKKNDYNVYWAYEPFMREDVRCNYNRIKLHLTEDEVVTLFNK